MLPIHPPKLLHAGTALVSCCCTSQIPFHRLFSTLPKQPAILSQWPGCILYSVTPWACDASSTCCWKPLGSNGSHISTAWLHPAFAYMMLPRGLSQGCRISYRKTRHVSSSGLASLLKEKHSYKPLLKVKHSSILLLREAQLHPSLHPSL